MYNTRRVCTFLVYSTCNLEVCSVFFKLSFSVQKALAEYEVQWEGWRQQLLQKRDQMRKQHQEQRQQQQQQHQQQQLYQHQHHQQQHQPQHHQQQQQQHVIKCETEAAELGAYHVRSVFYYDLSSILDRFVFDLEQHWRPIGHTIEFSRYGEKKLERVRKSDEKSQPKTRLKTALEMKTTMVWDQP